eukprot:TRINITY_DN8928_c0_g1_i1.p1 TRINITY_DN8928_c0_g1~~TRINITY_DN8928_c0_g1_i1.p1  ORF type:complete len:696 (+),score=160.97 TRINITY_DN8928_c0_g1_i1:96-2183(+)
MKEEEYRLEKPNKFFKIFSTILLIYSISALLFMSISTKHSFQLHKQEIKEGSPTDALLLKMQVEIYLEEEREREMMKREEMESREILDKDENNKEIDDIVDESERMKKSKRMEDALKLLNGGIEKYPNSNKLAAHKGGYYWDKEDWRRCAEWFMKAHELNPKNSQWIVNSANCLRKSDQHSEAADWIWKAYQSNPSFHTLVEIFDIRWKANIFTDYQKLLGKVWSESMDMIARGTAPDIGLFTALHFPFNASHIFAIAKEKGKSFDAIAKKSTHPSLPINSWDGKRKIRVGYLSPDIRLHAVGVQIQSMFGYHDKEQFEILIFSCNKDSHDRLTEKMRNAADEFYEVYEKDVYEAAKIVNDAKPDILIDLGLYTAYSRMDVMALRPAPIQVAWLGLAATTGSRFYDYIIADPFVITPEFEPYYIEKPVIMPHSYHIFDHKQNYPVPPMRMKIERSHFHSTLPSDIHRPPFLYCNHANNYRLDPYIIHRWVEIIKRVPDSVLVFKHHSDDSTRNMEKYMNDTYPELHANHDSESWPRYIFHKGGGHNHIDMKTICDIFLDIPKYNGHSTSGDMLWGGIPLITEPLTTMASRAAASFAISSGIAEVSIANSGQEYIDKAVYYGIHRDEIEAARKKLEDERMINPLFDTFLFTKHLEDAYKQMMDIEYNQQKKPRKIIVNNLIKTHGAEARMRSQNKD